MLADRVSLSKYAARSLNPLERSLFPMSAVNSRHYVRCAVRRAHRAEPAVVVASFVAFARIVGVVTFAFVVCERVWCNVCGAGT